jgi:3-isopropylmalate/(R)-2-methylmalate dehydratase small subunit
LLEGLDEIGLTLRHAAEIAAFEKRHDAAFWAAPRPNANTEMPQAVTP